MSESTDWLDTQTKAQLAADPPDKLAPPIVSGFSLVLLQRGPDRLRVERILTRLVVNLASISTECPCVVRRGLSLADALLGQFEFICADSISIFVGDEVAQNAPPTYLNDLFGRLRKSPEFQLVTVCVRSVPDDDRGIRFLEQFFGHALKLPATQVVAYKKARIMQHWASKLGAVVDVTDPGDGAPE